MTAPRQNTILFHPFQYIYSCKSQTLKRLFELTRRPLRTLNLISYVASGASGKQGYHTQVFIARWEGPRTLSRATDTDLDVFKEQEIMLVATPGFQVLHQVFPALASAESAEPAVPRGDGLPCHGVNGCPIQTTLHLGLTTSFHHCQKIILAGPLTCKREPAKSLRNC